MGSLKKFKPIWFSCICIYERKALLHTWEPSAARLLKVTPVVYPHLNDLTRKFINFDPHNLESQK